MRDKTGQMRWPRRKPKKRTMLYLFPGRDSRHGPHPETELCRMAGCRPQGDFEQNKDGEWVIRPTNRKEDT